MSSCSSDCSDCKNELNLCKACIKKAKVQCLKACKAIIQRQCSDLLEVHQLNAESETVNNLCVATKLNASSVSALSLNATNLCAQSGSFANLCVDNLTAPNFPKCEKYRAQATLAADTLYALGSPLNWDTVLDDPNNNVALAPFSYTVPVSGYYVATFDLNSANLVGSKTIVGNPVGLLSVLVNGLPGRSQQAPYLSFSSDQTGQATALGLLNAGDVITMKYDVLVFDSVLGLVPYVGSVTIKANGSQQNSSGFAIHLLSLKDCPVPPGQTCQPCPLPELPCSPLEILCDRNDCPPMTEDPCHPCEI